MNFRSTWLSIFGLGLTFLLGTVAWGQPAEPPMKKADEEKKVDPDALREQTIYVPYSKLKGVFEEHGRGVFVPYEKFQELWKAAQEATKQRDEIVAPFGALITEIDSEATVTGDVMTVKATATIEVLREGWQEVPLRLGDAALKNATIEGKPARVIFDENRGYLLVVEKKGKEAERLTLKLEYSKAYAKSPGSNRVSFAAPQAPVNRWRIRVPDAGAKINVQPMLAATKAEDEAKIEGFDPKKEALVLAFVGAAGEVTIDWTAKAEGASGLDALVNVRVQESALIEEGVVRTRAQLDYEISRAELKQLEIEVPADQKVVNVFDANVQKWEVKAGEGGAQLVVVQLFQPARGNQRLTIELEQFTKDAEAKAAPADPKPPEPPADPMAAKKPAARDISIANVKAVPGESKAAVRQQGVVVARLSDDLRGEVTKRTGLLQFDTNEVMAMMQLPAGTNQFSYRYSTLPFELVLKVEKVEPEIDVTQLVETYLEPDQLTVHWLGVYQIDKAGVYQLEVQVPAGMEIRRVEGRQINDAQPVAVDTHYLTGDKKDRLVVNLSHKAFGKVALWIELQQRLTDPNLLAPTGKTSDIDLPVPQVVGDGIVRARGGLIVHAPESLRVLPKEMDQLRDIALAEAYYNLPSQRAGLFPTTRAVRSYAFTQEPADLTVTVDRRKPQITVAQFLSVNVESGVVKYEATFFYNVLYSGVKSLRLDVPKKIAKDLRNQTPQFQDQPMVPHPEGVVADYEAWELKGDQEILGAVQVKYVWEEKLDLSVGAAKTFAPPRLVPQGTDRAWGQIAVVKAEDIDVSAGDKMDALRPIDPQRDLMGGATVANATRAFEFHEAWKLDLTATRYELQEVKRTSFDRAVARVVVTRANEVAVQVLYRVRTARQRLAFKLPDNVNPADAFDSQPLRINGQPVALEQDPKQYYIPLANRSPDVPFVLELRYTIPTGGASRLELPTFPEDPAVQQVYLAAYLPQDEKLLGSKGPWTYLERDSKGLFTQPHDLQTQQYITLETIRVNDPQQPSPLLNWVRSEVPGAEQAGDNFNVDGNLHLFSSLRPPAGSDGALRLTAVNDKLLYGGIFALVLAGGVALMWHHLGVKIVGAAGLVAAALLIGVFTPTLATALSGQALGWAIGLVALLWLGQGGFWCATHCPTWWSDFWASRVVSNEAPTTDSAAAAPEASATPFAQKPAAPADTPLPETKPGDSPPPLDTKDSSSNS